MVFLRLSFPPPFSFSLSSLESSDQLLHLATVFLLYTYVKTLPLGIYKRLEIREIKRMRVETRIFQKTFTGCSRSVSPIVRIKLLTKTKQKRILDRNSIGVTR